MTAHSVPHGYYVYTHHRATTGEIFYVGKGCGKRAWDSGNRNSYWHRIVKKHGLVVKMQQVGLQEWASFELECDLIALHGRKDLGLGPLVNHTDGGDGVTGRRITQEDKDRSRKNATKQMAQEGRKEYQSAVMKAYYATPSARKAASERQRKRCAKETERQAMSERTRKQMQDPARREQHSKTMQALYKAQPERLIAMGEATKKRFENPQYRAEQSQRTKRHMTDPQVRERLRQSSLAARQNPEYIEKFLAGRKKIMVPVLCNNALYFESMSAAVEWLKNKKKPFPHAQSSKIGAAARSQNRLTAYGYIWSLLPAKT